MSKQKIVVCRIDGNVGRIEGCVKGKRATVLSRFWFNGEGWYRLRDEGGKVFESPDMLWDEVR